MAVLLNTKRVYVIHMIGNTTDFVAQQKGQCTSNQKGVSLNPRLGHILTKRDATTVVSTFKK